MNALAMLGIDRCAGPVIGEMNLTVDGRVFRSAGGTAGRNK